MKNPLCFTRTVWLSNFKKKMFLIAQMPPSHVSIKDDILQAALTPSTSIMQKSNRVRQGDAVSGVRPPDGTIESQPGSLQLVYLGHGNSFGHMVSTLLPSLIREEPRKKRKEKKKTLSDVQPKWRLTHQSDLARGDASPADHAALLAERCSRHSRPETEPQSPRTLIGRIATQWASEQLPSPPSFHLCRSELQVRSLSLECGDGLLQDFQGNSSAKNAHYMPNVCIDASISPPPLPRKFLVFSFPAFIV